MRADETITLIIGDKRYSSWSLRPWLALKQAGLAFEEDRIWLRRPETRQDILKRSPSGKVPALKRGPLLVWDSLAICEFAAELAPDAGLWPADREVRAVARAAVAEMHSGFPALRSRLPMDFARRHDLAEVATDEVMADIERIQALWTDLRTRFGAGGDFLFGDVSIADCFYAPVCSRFVTYGVPLDEPAATYVEAVMAHPAMREWASDAEAEEREAG